MMDPMLLFFIGLVVALGALSYFVKDIGFQETTDNPSSKDNREN
jgi:hypothetical protein